MFPKEVQPYSSESLLPCARSSALRRSMNAVVIGSLVASSRTSGNVTTSQATKATTKMNPMMKSLRITVAILRCSP
jgi:hypothetical protein